jgi:hypothetical protein
MSMSQLQQQNIPAASAYTEYSVVIPPKAKQITFNVRSGSQPLFWYMAPSGSSNPGSSSNLPAVYNTIPAGASRTIFGTFGGQTIYFQTPGSSQVLEVDYYEDV